MEQNDGVTCSGRGAALVRCTTAAARIKLKRLYPKIHE